MAPKRARRGSDADYVPSGKRKRFEAPAAELDSEDELKSFDINSSAPGSPSKSMAVEEEDDLDTITELPFPLLSSLITQSAYPSTPSKAGKAAASSTSPLTPIIPHLPSSSGPLPTPPRRGRPNIRKARKHTRVQLTEGAANQESPATFDRRARERVRAIQEQRKKEEAAKRKAEEAALREARREEIEKKKQWLAQDLYAELAQKVTGGVNVERARTTDGVTIDSMGEFFKCLLSTGGQQQVSAKITRLCQNHGSDIIHGIYDRARAAGDTFIDETMAKKYREEGAALRQMFARDSSALSDAALLKGFSMEKAAEEVQEAAPLLWQAFANVSGPAQKSEKPLVFTTICAMLAILRSQRSNNFQLVMGYFLLASGSSKREMQVLAHAGLSVSYSTIIEHLKKLSADGLQKIQEIVKRCMVFIVWDNLNMAFRVESQRFKAKDHFDNGTTATMIPLWNPFTKTDMTPHGTLPHDMKAPRNSTDPIVDWNVDDVFPRADGLRQLEEACVWKLKAMAIANIPNLSRLTAGEWPEVDQIALHKTEQYPLPAMREEESSIEGTIEVYMKILKNLGMTDELLEQHGLLFTDGDLLTDSLVDKVESSRRNSTTAIASLGAVVRRFGLFHCKMAGCRMVVNEHWGVPNAATPGSLWWENNIMLERKPMVAGWGAKKATPFKPAHELLNISLSAHVVDAFRLHCGIEEDGRPNLARWARQATQDDLDVVARRVLRNLFSTAAYDEAKKQTYQDTIFQNAILYNRDGLHYLVFVDAIKRGDIGQVVNVLRIWGVMMHSPKTMPKYADAIFETLARLERFDPTLRKFFLHNWLVNLTGSENRFKEVDLLQEHQNFWAKHIYTAKGSNRSWEWLAMVTVCIFTLRDTMRMVQRAFNITPSGLTHTVPSYVEEVERLVEALERELIQQSVLDRAANAAAKPARELFEEGSNYANARRAFARFTKDPRRPVRGTPEPEDIEQYDQNSGEEFPQDEYEASREDLEMDLEESYVSEAAILRSSAELADDVFS